MAKNFTYDFTPNGPNPDILWMEANEQKGGCSGTAGEGGEGSGTSGQQQPKIEPIGEKEAAAYKAYRDKVFSDEK